MGRVIDLSSSRTAEHEPLLAEQNGTMQYVDELYDAADELAHAWDELTQAVIRRLEGWEDPQRRVTDAHRRVRVVTGAANAALEQALREASA